MASRISEEWFADIGLDQDTGNALQDKGFDDLESLKLLEEDLVTKCFSTLTLKQQLTLRAKIKELKGDSGGSPNLPSLAEDDKVSRQDYDENPAPKSELRLVVFGKTGNGKSSTANTILGKVGFVKHEGQGSGTKVCKKQQVKLNGKNIKIIDTPGVADALRAPEEILHEITKCLSFARPGPHALLFVVNANARFTQEEENAYFALRRLFASNLNSYVIVVFTHFDELENDEEKLNKMLDDYGKEVDQAKKDSRKLPDIRKILADVNNRFVSFSNTADKKITDEQVLKLLETIQDVADTNDSPHFEDTATQAATVNLEKQINAIKQSDFRLTANEVWEKLRRSAGQDQSAEAKKLMQIVDEIGKQGQEQQPIGRSRSDAPQSSENQKRSCLVM